MRGSVCVCVRVQGRTQGGTPPTIVGGPGTHFFQKKKEKKRKKKKKKEKKRKEKKRKEKKRKEKKRKEKKS